MTIQVTGSEANQNTNSYFREMTEGEGRNMLKAKGSEQRWSGSSEKKRPSCIDGLEVTDPGMK
jgi:hypothetical protein